MFIDSETSEALDLTTVLVSRYIANASEHGHVFVAESSDQGGNEDGGERDNNDEEEETALHLFLFGSVNL